MRHSFVLLMDRYPDQRDLYTRSTNSRFRYSNIRTWQWIRLHIMVNSWARCESRNVLHTKLMICRTEPSDSSRYVSFPVNSLYWVRKNSQPYGYWLLLTSIGTILTSAVGWTESVQRQAVSSSPLQFPPRRYWTGIASTAWLEERRKLRTVATCGVLVLKSTSPNGTLFDCYSVDHGQNMYWLGL